MNDIQIKNNLEAKPFGSGIVMGFFTWLSLLHTCHELTATMLELSFFLSIAFGWCKFIMVPVPSEGESYCIMASQVL